MPWDQYLKLQFHFPLMMWNQTRKILEEENKAQKEQEEKSGYGNMPTSPSGMMSYAKSMMGSSGVSMPSGMPSMSSIRMPH